MKQAIKVVCCVFISWTAETCLSIKAFPITTGATLNSIWFLYCASVFALLKKKRVDSLGSVPLTSAAAFGVSISAYTMLRCTVSTQSTMFAIACLCFRPIPPRTVSKIQQACHVFAALIVVSAYAIHNGGMTTSDAFASATLMYSILAAESCKNDDPRSLLIYSFPWSLATFLGLVYFGKFETGNEEIIGLLTGTLTAAFTVVVIWAGRNTRSTSITGSIKTGGMKSWIACSIALLGVILDELVFKPSLVGYTKFSDVDEDTISVDGGLEMEHPKDTELQPDPPR
jgi:hypothetical protein